MKSFIKYNVVYYCMTGKWSWSIGNDEIDSKYSEIRRKYKDYTNKKLLITKREVALTCDLIVRVLNRIAFLVFAWRHYSDSGIILREIKEFWVDFSVKVDNEFVKQFISDYIEVLEKAIEHLREERRKVKEVGVEVKE